MEVVVNGSVQVIEVAEDTYQIVVDSAPVQVISVALGPPGPNEVTTATTSNIDGILYANGSNISAATAGEFPTLNQSTTGEAGSVATINGLVSAGSNITLSGSGTAVSPYQISASGGGGGSGTVTSVALTVPAEFSVSGSPVTTSGTLAISKATQNPNLIYAGPTTGSAAQPTFRNLVAADVPTLNQDTTGQAGTVATINGLVQGGDNITLTGHGTTSDPYVVTATTTATFLLALSTPAVTGTNLTNVLLVPSTSTIVSCYAYAKTAPTGSSLIFDILQNGTSIWSINTGNRLSIAASANLGTQTSFDSTALNAGDILTVNCDQIGSTIAGQNITIGLVIQ
jgi:hypothetical protein